jgi:hypothetical protein
MWYSCLDAAADHILEIMVVDSVLIPHLQLVQPFGDKFGHLNFSTSFM